MSFLDEAQVEETLMDLFRDGLGYEVAFGPDIAHGGSRSERDSYTDVVLVERLRGAVERINPDLPDGAIEDAVSSVLRAALPSLIETNRQIHRMLTEGVDVEYSGDEGRIIHDKVWLLDFDELENNDWLAVNGSRLPLTQMKAQGRLG